MITSWAQLSTEFQKLVLKAGGPSKSSSGILEIAYTFEGEVSISAGTYDIGWLGQHTLLGPYPNEVVAQEALAAEIKKWRELVDNDCDEDEVC